MSMRIAIVTGSLSRSAGGLFNSVRRSAQEFQKLGHEVSVFGVADQFAEEDLSAWHPIKVFAGKRIGPKILNYSSETTQHFKAGKFDIVHQHGIWQAPSWQTIGWRQENQGPTMISPRGMLDAWAIKNSALKKRLIAGLFENKNLRNTNCLHALNPQELNSFRQYDLTNPVAVIPNGIDVPDTLTRDHNARPYWWREDKKHLLFIGRLHPKKGLTELLHAWQLLRESESLVSQSWKLIIGGWDDGGHLTTLTTLAQELGLEDQIEFIGPVYGTEKHNALCFSDAFVLPSLSEGLPMSILEAWAYQLPVLMTQECNLPEGFNKQAATEISVQPELMAKVFNDTLRSDLLDTMKQNCRPLVDQCFSWSSVARRHLEVYDWMTNPSLNQPKDIDLGGSE